ncbi:MAG: DUF883 family protein [Burkholderiaceae bacterium]|nr:DUF883 family protein [Burkholderiaceae bacterium]
MDTANEAGTKLMENLKTIILDAEKMLENSAQHGSESFHKAKEKLESTLADAKFAMRELEDAVISKAKSAAVCTAEYAKEHPWHAAGVAALVGVMLGMLIARK